MSKRDARNFFQDHRVLLRSISLLLLLASVTLDVQSFIWPKNDSFCVRVTSAWSPALEAIRYEWGMFTEPARWEPRSPLVGKHKPSPQVEEAWATLIPDGMITIPRNRLEALNHTESFDWKRPKGNEESVYAVPEVFLQISCLDFLRQQTYRIDYPHAYPDSHEVGFGGSKAQVMHRTDLCLERLRRAFICWADVTPIIFNEVDGKISIDLETLHYCRNFDTILEWTKGHGVNVDENVGFGDWRLSSSFA